MPGNGREHKCILCKKRTKPKERRPVNRDIRRYLLKYLFTSATDNDVMCQKCRHQYYLHDTKKIPVSTQTSNVNNDIFVLPPQTSTNIRSPPSIQLNIPSTPKSHARCFLCKKPGPKLIVISSTARITAFIESNILIPADSRCCPSHIQMDSIDSETLKNVSTIDSSYMNKTSILNLLSSLRNICSASSKRLCFNNLKDSEYSSRTGLSTDHFNELCRCLEGKLRNSPTRSVRTTIGLFLLKLKSGISNKILATLFGLTISSLRRGIKSVRQALMVWFVPHYLGLRHVSRSDIIQQHTKPLAQSIFGTKEDGDSAKLILVLDGTYIYIQKSNNFYFQRRSFSVHKGRPLVKPMVVVTTTGYYLTVVGPYLSSNSDAQILNHMLHTDVEQIKSYVEKDDVFVVDRGFRDSISLLQDLGIKAEMPAFLQKGQRQMSTEDANTSRLVTKIRWVVESANARIKRWKYLDKVLPTNQVPYIGDYTRIVCALANKFFPPISSPDSDDRQIADMMLSQLNKINELKSFIETENIERKQTIWRNVDCTELENFPRLSEDQLRSLTCGVYQLKLSPFYIQEHLQGGCNVHVHVEDENLIRVRIQSRHVSAKKYLLWIKFSQSEILAWYCKCRSGARVVGVCSHIAAIVWYLSYARLRYVYPASLGIRDWTAHLTDARNLPEPIDQSESESECND